MHSLIDVKFQLAVVMRYSVFDGLRGAFLLLMMYNHAASVLQSHLGTVINHHRLGFADAAHGFVFLSGLVIALYFMRVLREHGEEALAPLVRRRIVFIYKYHIGALLGLAVLAKLLPQAAGRLDVFSQMGPDEYLALVLLINQPSFFDILPMYMVFIAGTPLVLRMFERGQAWSVLAASIGLWLIAQTGVISVLVESIERKIDTTGLDIRLGSFGIFSWQLIYLAGLMFGYFTFSGRFNVNFVRSLPASFPKIAVAAFMGILLLQQFISHHPASFDHVINSLNSAHSKWNFSLFFVVSVAVYAIIITWLYVAGPHSSNPLIVFISKKFQDVLNSRPLTLLGQSSIQVFTYHLIVVYLLSALVDLHPMSGAARFVLLILSTLSLFGFAMVWRWTMIRSLVASS